MKQRTLSIVLLATVVLATAVLTGCNGTKQKMASLEADNENLRGQVQRRDNENELIKSELAGAESDLRSRDAEIASLRAELSTKPAVAAQSTNPVMKVSGDVLFRSGQASLTSEGQAALNKVVSTLKSQYAGQRISVEGHTDSSPLVRTKEKWETNLWLSANRAKAVADYLISQGIPENRVSIVGHGAGQPSGGAKTQDRRVEIIVLLR